MIINIELCGNGLKEINEACDDGNRENGDGCASDCQSIELGWICKENDHGYSECSKFEHYGKYEHRQLSNVSEDQTYVRSFIFSIVALGVIFNLISCIFSTASYQSIFSSFNFLQLILLIPLTEVYLPNKPSVFIKSAKPSLLTFFSISCDDLSFIKSTFAECYYSQTNSGLYAIGLEQGSTIMNMHILLLFFFALIIVHLITLLFYLCARKKEGGCSRCISKFFSILSFSVYIRLIIESALLLLLSTLSEIKEGKLSSDMYIRSFTFALAILLFLVMITLVFFIHWIIYGREESMDDSIFVDLYRGTRQTMMGRSFNLQFIFRRVLLACIFTFLYSQSMTVKFSILIGIQCLYTAVLIIIRPFNCVKDNLLEIFNEVGYLILCVWIAYFNTSSRWNTFSEWVYWCILISIVSGFFIISFIFMIISIVKRERNEPKTGISNQTIKRAAYQLSKKNGRNTKSPEKEVNLGSASAIPYKCFYWPIEKEKSHSDQIQSLDDDGSKDSARFRNTGKVGPQDKNNEEKSPESYFEYARRKYFGDKLSQRLIIELPFMKLL